MTPTRPHIGITTGFEEDQQRLDLRYVRAVEFAGGLPLIVPMLENEAVARAFAAMLDGLIITGGPGITRGMIGNLPQSLPPVDPIRDRSDVLIFEAVDLPVLGICYGMQFINAMAGGTIYGDLHQGINDSLAHSRARGGVDHPVMLTEGTRLHAIFGGPTLDVNTYHSQSIASVGGGLRVSAMAPDGVIEGIESEDGRLIGVQFHPERMPDTGGALFADFIERCRS
ncbi:MAG: gamma-glutamyl-gamma-aminobutyrate hydrolase family protein [Chloroflexota bacterium]